MKEDSLYENFLSFCSGVEWVMNKKKIEVICEGKGCSKTLCKISTKAHSKLFDDGDNYILCRKCYLKMRIRIK